MVLFGHIVHVKEIDRKCMQFIGLPFNKEYLKYHTLYRSRKLGSIKLLPLKDGGKVASSRLTII